MNTFSKDDLINKLEIIRNKGWIPNSRSGNTGGVGNTLEDLLGIDENNLPIPNATEWELKCQRKKTSSLITLFHIEPSPRALKFVPKIFLPLYGWEHKKIPNELSFRQTINGLNNTDRGFGVRIDRSNKKILISFSADKVYAKHNDWLINVEKKIGLKELNPQPYWGFNDLKNKAGTKLINCFYIKADVKRENKLEFFHYNEVMILQKFSFRNFLKAIEKGYLLIDFDARTGHNHGTKFRLRQDRLPDLYSKVTSIW